MNKIWKGAALAAVGVLDVVVVLLIVKVALHRHHAGKYETVGKGIDERLVASTDALGKATAHVKGVFEQIKNLKI